ncbi:MAG: hypothetical protein GWP05_01655 [Anaerolineaceae bacterium]|nr:hypothetical protein [Anaerolineaceae bacterium]
MLTAAIIVCFGVTIYLLATGPFDPDNSEFREVVEKGPRVPVVCINPECKHTGKMRAKVDDNDWPKPCPECGETTLYRSARCPNCGQPTAMKHDAKGTVVCSNCKKTFQLLLQGKESGEGLEMGGP